MKISNVGHWVRDYSYTLPGFIKAFLFRNPPGHYLGYVKEAKQPIILIPGLTGKWNFLKKIADPLSLQGHPIYVLKHLGYNLASIPDTAKSVHDFIAEKNLNNVVIIAHSKGGIVGKYLLAHCNQDKRIKKLIAIAAPFAGTDLVKALPFKSFKEFSRESEIIKKLMEQTTVNKDIISIYPVYDNKIRPLSSCILEGAENIQVPVHGHNRMLFDNKVRDLVTSKVAKLSDN